MAEATVRDHDTLTEKDLSMLLRDPILKTCTNWKRIGLELGLRKSILEAIAKDHPTPDYIEGGKEVMLYKWLTNSENPTLNKLHRAIRRVIRSETETEERKAMDSINQLEGLLDEWEDRNQKIISDKRLLHSKLKEEESWLPNVVKWNVENDEWQRGEVAKQKTKIREALQQGDYRNSSFVREFLQTKGFSNAQQSNLTNERVEGILYQALLEIEIDRSGTTGRRYQDIRKHHMRLKKLQAEINESKILLNKRLVAYDEIQAGLQEIGMKSENLKELNRQLQYLRKTENDYIDLSKQCDDFYHQGERNLRIWKYELSSMLRSFDDSITAMTVKEVTILRSLGLEESGKRYGGIVGGVVTFGSTQGRRVGSAAGGTVGRLADKFFGPVESTETVISLEAQNYKNTLEKGRLVQKRLRKILAE